MQEVFAHLLRRLPFSLHYTRTIYYIFRSSVSQFMCMHQASSFVCDVHILKIDRFFPCKQNAVLLFHFGVCRLYSFPLQSPIGKLATLKWPKKYFYRSHTLSFSCLICLLSRIIFSFFSRLFDYVILIKLIAQLFYFLIELIWRNSAFNWGCDDF